MTMQPIEKQVTDAFELVRLEELWEQELACEGSTHPHGTYGHRLDEHAEFRVYLACGHKFLMCRGWVEAVDGKRVECHRDGLTTPIGAVRIEPFG